MWSDAARQASQLARGAQGGNALQRAYARAGALTRGDWNGGEGPSPTQLGRPGPPIGIGGGYGTPRGPGGPPVGIAGPAAHQAGINGVSRRMGDSSPTQAYYQNIAPAGAYGRWQKFDTTNMRRGRR